MDTRHLHGLLCYPERVTSVWAHAYLSLFVGSISLSLSLSLSLSHTQQQQQQVMEGPPIDHTPRVPRDITKSRIDNFMLKGSIFYEMGIHYGLWTHRHNGPPHVTLSVYSVPDLKVLLDLANAHNNDGLTF